MSTSPSDAAAIFLELATLSKSDRQNALERIDSSDSELSIRVAALLRAYDEPRIVLAGNAQQYERTEAIEGFSPEATAKVQQTLDADSTTELNSARRVEETTALSPTATHPHVIISGTVLADRYILKKILGQGGMGEVWVAQQTAPVKRDVALKLVKSGFGSAGVLTRFDQERQALAMMDHPNIARVLDGGLTPASQPFFVMELVNGKPLTDYCDEHKLTVRARLSLFVQICQAVQHAHQKGVVHRDLKPANILVTEVDGEPIAKVIDFGVAKAVEGKITDETMATQIGAVIGTLSYMSPEQAGFAAGEIDTRTDIFSLGVILYELLTGLRPIDADGLQSAGFTEWVRAIKEDEPTKPSARIANSETLTEAAAIRRTEAKRLIAMLQGELDWVIMKCLEKQRTRRYDSAAELGKEVLRFLANEPVEARPPSASYRIGKFIRRHRVAAFAGTCVFLSLVAGIIGTSLGMMEANRQFELANEETIQKDLARQAEARRAEGERRAKLAEREAKENAQKRLEQLKRGNRLLTDVFADLDIRKINQGSDPLETVLAQRFMDAAENLQGDLVGDPQVVAHLQSGLGQSLRSLGFADDAIPLQEASLQTSSKELGPDHADTLEVELGLAITYRKAGRSDEAVQLLEHAFAGLTEQYGNDDRRALVCMDQLGGAYGDLGEISKSLEHLQNVLALRRKTFGDHDPDTLASINNVAKALSIAGKSHESISLYEEALEQTRQLHGEEHVDTLVTTNNYTGALIKAGRFSEAIPIGEEALKVAKSALGPRHPTTLNGMNTLAIAYGQAGLFNESTEMLRQTFELRKETLGLEHPMTLTTMANLAVGYLLQQRYDEGLPLLEEVLVLSQALKGKNHPDTLETAANLAGLYRKLGNLEKAVPLFEESLRAQESSMGPMHPQTLMTMDMLAGTYRELERFEEALTLHVKASEGLAKVLGPDHPSTLISKNNYALALRAAGRLEPAIDLLEETLELTEKRFGANHPNTLSNRANLALVYKDTGQVEKSLPMLEAVIAATEGNGEFKWVRLHLLDAYILLDKFATADEVAERLVSESGGSTVENPQAQVSRMIQLGKQLFAVSAMPAAEYILEKNSALDDTERVDPAMMFQSTSLYGDCLLAQTKFLRAETVLLENVERAKAILADGTNNREGRTTYLSRATDQLVKLYTEWHSAEPDQGYDRKADQWREVPIAEQP